MPHAVRGEDVYPHECSSRRDEPGWFVDLATLDELLGFLDEHGHGLVVSREPQNGGVVHLQIYDGYIE